MSQIKVKMRQISICRWQIETEKGTVLVEDLMIGPIAEAEEYVKRYISSYPLWTYEMILLPKGGI